MMVSSRLEQIIEDAEQTGEPWVITRDGKPIAVICPVNSWQRLTEALPVDEREVEL